MKMKLFFVVLLIVCLMFGVGSSSAMPGASPLGTAFTYQGRLDRDGTPYTGACDFQFSLWDEADGGEKIGDTLIFADLPVSAGLFIVKLDFGSYFYTGTALWLEVSLQCPGDSGITTFPHQELTPVPYALYASAAPWNGLMDVPEGFSDGLDNDTTYSAGSGLVLSTGTFSIDSDFTQRRVSSGCDVGSTIRTINEDGSVVCQADMPGRNTFSFSTLAPTVAGYVTSTIGSDGLALIVYYDYFYLHDYLMIAHCNDIACSTATAFIIESNAGFASITIGTDGLGLISYAAGDDPDLKVAHCEDIICSSVTTNTLDSIGNVGWHTAITIGTDGLGLISYLNYTTHNLKVAHCDDITCSTATVFEIVSGGAGGFHISITIGGDGLGLISYFVGALRVAHCNDIACSSATVSTIDSSYLAGYYTSITTGTDGLGLISYNAITDGALKVAHCSNASCSSATTYTLDLAGNISEQATSITIGADGLGVISYYDYPDHDLKVAHCSNQTCTTANITTVDATGDVGLYNSITIGIDGFPLISYIDTTHNTLKMAHCSNTLCIPYFRLR
jgi:hypothetical protein